MQRYFSNKLVDNYFILNDDDIYHIKTVMRMQEGDLIEVVFDKKVYECCLENVKLDPKIKVQKELEKSLNSLPLVSLIVPFLKENKLDLILQKATEMGVYKIYLCPMKRCLVKLQGNKIENKINRWKRIVKEASEQSKRVEIPEIEIIENIKKLQKLDGLNLICSTKEMQQNVKKVLTKFKNCDRINLVIGPEGGLTNNEEEILKGFGYLPITLGNNILRVETVPLFLMSVIKYEFME